MPSDRPVEGGDEGPSAERSLLAAIDSGDRDAALNELMKAYGRAVYQYCRYMVEDAHLADDAHQLTFIQAYQDLSSFQRRSSVRSWLFGIARHRCLDLLKSRRRWYQRFQPLDELPRPPRVEGGEDERLIARGLAKALEECLRRLAPQVRAAVLLRHQQGFSYAEMAQALGKRAAALQMCVARALPVLRGCLQKQGQTP